MNKVQKNGAQFLEDELRLVANSATQDKILVEALIKLSGWGGGKRKAVHQVADELCLTRDDITKAKQSLEQVCSGISVPTLENVVVKISEWLPCAAPTVGYWLAKEGMVRSNDFSISVIMEAADMFGIELPFKALSLAHGKWLVDPKNPDDFDSSLAEKIANITMPLAELRGIIAPQQFESLRAYSANSTQQWMFWEVMEASPELAVEERSYVICKAPREDAEVVKRIDRLLSFARAVPLSVALIQITRDGGRWVLPSPDLRALTAFIDHCSYYELDGGDVVAARQLVVDQELSSLERPVIMSLLSAPHGATFEELQLATRNTGISAENLRLVLQTSPLVIAAPEDRFALLDPSTYDDILSQVSPQGIGKSSVQEAQAESLSDSDAVVDLSSVGTTGQYWWAMYAGKIPHDQLQGARGDQHPHMVILDPVTDRCIGLVRTSRVFNKYSAGNRMVFSDDKGLVGRELPRFVSWNDLRSALEESPYVFYNDTPVVGQESWGIVQRGDVRW
jgi:hypothetical protein